MVVGAGVQGFFFIIWSIRNYLQRFSPDSMYEAIAMQFSHEIAHLARKCSFPNSNLA